MDWFEGVLDSFVRAYSVAWGQDECIAVPDRAVHVVLVAMIKYSPGSVAVVVLVAFVDLAGIICVS